jgi:hypothetical protein
VRSRAFLAVVALFAAASVAAADPPSSRDPRVESAFVRGRYDDVERLLAASTAPEDLLARAAISRVLRPSTPGPDDAALRAASSSTDLSSRRLAWLLGPPDARARDPYPMPKAGEADPWPRISALVADRWHREHDADASRWVRDGAAWKDAPDEYLADFEAAYRRPSYDGSAPNDDERKALDELRTLAARNRLLALAAVGVFVIAALLVWWRVGASSSRVA